METTIRETRRLVRPREGRWLGGVAAGLGTYFDLNPAIYRIAFVALALAGGTGILLYLAAWAIIPEEGQEDSLAADVLRRHRDHPSRALGLAVLAFVAVVVLSSAHFWAGPGNLWLAAALTIAAVVWWQVSKAPVRGRGGALFPIALGVLVASLGIVAILDVSGAAGIDWRIVLAALVAVTGALLVVGATTGRAVGAVALLAVALLVALAFALTVRVPIFAGIGDRTSHPVAATSVARRYEQGIGNFRLDLSDVHFPAGTTDVKATLGIGDLTVRVPYGTKVIVDAHAGAGQVSLFGLTSDGRSVDSSATVGRGADVLVLHAHVGLGRLEVKRG